jgi:Adenylate cyclase
MSTEILFQTHLVLGYVAWLLCFGTYIVPWLRSIDRVKVQRAIATLHSFRFFGLVFILPGVVSPNLPAGFAVFAAYGDFATGVLAMLALLTVRIRLLFWLFVVAFNLMGTVDLIVDYYHAIQVGPSCARRVAGRDIRDPDHLCAAADDHAYRRILLSGASSVQGGSDPRRRCSRIIDRIEHATWLPSDTDVTMVSDPGVRDKLRTGVGACDHRLVRSQTGRFPG